MENSPIQTVRGKLWHLIFWFTFGWQKLSKNVFKVKNIFQKVFFFEEEILNLFSITRRQSRSIGFSQNEPLNIKRYIGITKVY